MLATIMSGEVDTADVFFLVGLILFLVAGVLSLVRHPPDWHPGIVPALGYFGLACVAFAWLAL